MKLRVLVVEDDSAMRKLLAKALPLTGLADFEVTEAADGAEALACFNPARTDIIFVDWQMPRMTGIELVRKLRASGKADHIPVVMVTGNRTMGHVSEALDDAGADLYITKPFTVDDLRRRLEKLVEECVAERAGSPAGHLSGLLEKLKKVGES